MTKTESKIEDKKTITVTLSDGSDHTIKQEIKQGESLLNMAKQFQKEGDLPFLGAVVDNYVYGLGYPPDHDCNVEFFTYKSKHGMYMYRRSLCLILARAVLELYRNARLAIDHSIGNCYYYDLYTDIPVSEKILSDIKEKMIAIIESDETFKRQRMPKEEAIALFQREGYPEKARLLKNVNTDKVDVVSTWKYIDIDFGPLVPSTSYLKVFDLKLYDKGFVLLFPDPANPAVPAQPRRQPKLFKAYRESKQWGKILEVNNVGRLNEIIKSGEVSDFIKTAEALHEKKIQSIADQILAKGSRIVLIAGPSSSGKTTFSKRLSIALRVNGLKPVALSLDNYFLGREFTPRDETGDYDFESLYALDLETFNQNMQELLEGRIAQIPEYDFHTGTRKAETTPLRINNDQILIIEGIHGLNEELTKSIAPEFKFKIYISALTQLVIDDYNRIATTDTRIIRRTVRDAKYRGYPASETLARWASVRRGEEQNIFPFQECNDAVFNSAIPYEWAVLRPVAEKLFSEIGKDSKYYFEAQRILKLLSFFTPLSAEEVPPTSLLREFIGGSSFKY